MIEIELTDYEMLMAAQVGLSRQMEARSRGLRDRYGAQNSDGWGLHIEGACGELAFAKAMGLYWDGSVGTFHRSGDVGNWQVRTRSKDNYDLIVRKNDSDDDRFVLVIGRAPHFDIVGWIYGRDAKHDIWLENHGGRTPAYFVPRASLKPIIGRRRKRARA